MHSIKNLIPAALNKLPTSPALQTSDWRPTLELRDESLRKAADACAKFVADVARNGTPYWLTLSGVPGNGKTMLATQTFAEARKYRDMATENHPAQHGTYDERRRRPFHRWIDETTFARLLLDDRQYDLPEYLAHEWLVAYDDLGSKRDAKDLIGDALFRFANQRLGKWTLWTTNLTMQEVSTRIDPRMSSRLIRDDNRLVTLTAGDYAMRPKK